METFSQRLRKNVPIIMLAISVKNRAQSSKYEVLENGRVDYNGDILLIHDAIMRFREDFPDQRIIRADVSKRIPDETARRGYRWEEIERVI